MKLITENDHYREKIRQTFNGQPISIVGNAASLLNSKHGPLIDGSCVLRMKAGIPTRPAAQGRRIDVHCFSTKPNLLKNLNSLEIGLDQSQTYLRNALSIWMSPKDRELCDEHLQLFYPLEAWDSLSKRLGHDPQSAQ